MAEIRFLHGHKIKITAKIRAHKRANESHKKRLGDCMPSAGLAQSKTLPWGVVLSVLVWKACYLVQFKNPADYNKKVFQTRIPF